ncbi:MAG: translation initiation factor [Gammaproteobacteria bacterium]|nr:translation initiation factor [Gammaproteobacteria bacterium]MBV9619503.1 translation initiation factor [Gammaproteobacteria bacterium]
MKPRHTYRGVVQRTASRATTVLNAPPAAPRVRVGRAVAGRGGKAVSVISGLPLDTAGLEELAGRLKRLCGAGGTVRNGTIEIQGEHRARLVAELGKLGYAAKPSGG